MMERIFTIHHDRQVYSIRSPSGIDRPVPHMSREQARRACSIINKMLHFDIRAPRMRDPSHADVAQG